MNCTFLPLGIPPIEIVLAVVVQVTFVFSAVLLKSSASVPPDTVVLPVYVLEPRSESVPELTAKFVVAPAAWMIWPPNTEELEPPAYVIVAGLPVLELVII